MMLELSYERIIEAGSGNTDAFHDLYEATSSYVYTLAYRVTQSRGDAEEVTQDVYVKLFKNLKSFRRDSSVKTWLYRVTTNAALDHIRKYKFRTKEVSLDHAKDVSVFHDKSAGNIESVTAESFFKDLNPEERACISLRAIDELSYDEIAKCLCINVNTVRTRLRRARLKMISLLKTTQGR